MFSMILLIVHPYFKRLFPFFFKWFAKLKHERIHLNTILDGEVPLAVWELPKIPVGS